MGMPPESESLHYAAGLHTVQPAGRATRHDSTQQRQIIKRKQRLLLIDIEADQLLLQALTVGGGFNGCLALLLQLFPYQLVGFVQVGQFSVGLIELQLKWQAAQSGDGVDIVRLDGVCSPLDRRRRGT